MINKKENMWHEEEALKDEDGCKETVRQAEVCEEEERSPGLNRLGCGLVQGSDHVVEAFDPAVQ